LHRWPIKESAGNVVPVCGAWCNALRVLHPT
jgi:hypothetical protein